MKKNYTHIAVVLDRSGSMASCWGETRGAYKRLIEDQKKLDGECTVSLAAFDDQYDLVLDFQKIERVSGDISFGPRGMTALYDAVGKTAESVREQISKMHEDDRPEKVVFVIQTDGFENASKEFRSDTVKKLLEERRGDGWEFMFVGASEASIANASSIGISANRSVLYNSAKTGDTFSMASDKLSAYRTVDLSCSGASVTLDWSEEEKQSLT